MWQRTLKKTVFFFLNKKIKINYRELVASFATKSTAEISILGGLVFKNVEYSEWSWSGFPDEGWSSSAWNWLKKCWTCFLCRLFNFLQLIPHPFRPKLLKLFVLLPQKRLETRQRHWDIKSTWNLRPLLEVMATSHPKINNSTWGNNISKKNLHGSLE